MEKWSYLTQLIKRLKKFYSVKRISYTHPKAIRPRKNLILTQNLASSKTTPPSKSYVIPTRNLPHPKTSFSHLKPSIPPKGFLYSPKTQTTHNLAQPKEISFANSNLSLPLQKCLTHPKPSPTTLPPFKKITQPKLSPPKNIFYSPKLQPT